MLKENILYNAEFTGDRPSALFGVARLFLFFFYKSEAHGQPKVKSTWGSGTTTGHGHKIIKNKKG